MAMRFKVTRLWIKHKGVIYRAGDLLPEEFTDRDKFRNVHPSRIGVAEVPVESPVEPPVVIEDKAAAPIINSDATEVVKETKPVSSVKGMEQAEVTKPSGKNTTGTNDRGALSK